MKGINLLEKSVVETEDDTKKKRKATVYSVILLIFFAIANVVVFFLVSSQNKQLSGLNTEINNQENLINSFKNREVKHHVLKEKMVWRCVAGKVKHGSVPTEGKIPRITLSLGFQIKDTKKKFFI